MNVFRLSKQAYKHDISGYGAERSGGRWNSVGTRILYTSENRSLCLAEFMVNADLRQLPPNLWMLTIEFPDDLTILDLHADTLPAEWGAFPRPLLTQKLGDEFVFARQHLAMRVPSSVVQREYNYLLNPLHPDFSSVKIAHEEPFRFDRRLLQRW